MDNGERTSLEQECQDIANKLETMMIKENKQKPPSSASSNTRSPLQSTDQDTENKENARKKRNRNRRKNKNKKAETTSDETEQEMPGQIQNNHQQQRQQQQQQQQQRQRQQQKKKRSKRRGRGEDRYYGRFHCRICNRMWESALVFTVAGTKIVKYKQGCKTCDSEEAWYFPFALELITCSMCGCQPCECRCEICDGLTRPRFWIHPETDEREEDPRFEYCECEEDEKLWMLGDNIDDTKPHLSDFCGRCKSGRRCQQRRGPLIIDFDDDDYDDV